jgi:uncharacterized protein YndB with AHSA1/START domain
MPVTDVQKDLDALTMTITAEFDAGVERLWGPPSHPAIFTDHDLTPGGRVAYYMTAPDGQRYHGWWRVEEVEPPTRLRFEDGFADDEGNPNPEMPTSVATVTLSEADGRTTMAIESRFSSREHLEQTIEMGGEQGMVEALGQVDALVAGG